MENRGGLASPCHVIRVAVESWCARPFLGPTMLTHNCRLKCNREQPCQNCTTRGEQTLCKYRVSQNGSTALESVTTSSRQLVNVGVMQERIDNLENLVRTLMAQGQKDIPAAVENGFLDETAQNQDSPNIMDGSANLPCRAGTTIMNGGHSVYKAANNWSDILQEVRIAISYQSFCPTTSCSL
jgi:hypothetical protein